MGDIVIYDENTEKWLFSSEVEPFYNTPASSHFHLWQALVGLEENIFSTKSNEVQMWDGVKRSFFEKKTEWNQDTNLVEALKTKNDWYFDRLRFSLATEVYDKNIKNSKFFKEIKNNELDYFWNYAALTNANSLITFFKELYHQQLPFNKNNQKFIFKQLLKDKKIAVHNAETSFLGKKIDWTIGAYITNKKPVFFSLRTYRSVDEPDLTDYGYRKNLIISQIFEVLNIN